MTAFQKLFQNGFKILAETRVRSGGSEVHAVTSVGAAERSEGPPQASSAPSGGSEVHAVTSVGATERSEGPSQASSAPSGGSEVHAVTSVGASF